VGTCTDYTHSPSCSLNICVLRDLARSERRNADLERR
jgi:hypothetical protein